MRALIARLSKLRASLRARLLLGSLALLAVGLTAADVTAYAALSQHLTSRTEHAVREAAARLEAAPLDRPVRLGPAAVQSLVPSGMFVTLLADDGDVIVTSTPLGTGPRLVTGPRVDVSDYPPGELREKSYGGGDEYLVMRLVLPADASITSGRRDGEQRRVQSVILGAPLSDNAAALSTLLRVEVWAAVAILLMWGMLSTLFLRLGLRPLRVMSDTAERIGAGSAELLPQGRPGSEMAALSAAINHAFTARTLAESKARAFLADASHELRTPVAAVQAWAELYQAGGIATDQGLQEAMDSIQEESARMSRMIEQMLLLARVDAGYPTTEGRVDLRALVSEACRSLRVIGGGRLQGPAVGEPLWVRADSTSVRTIVDNLITNALIHTPPEASVRVDLGHAQQGVCVDVDDEGPGLDLADLDTAFDRFWRADGARSRPGGSGLGLSIARTLARQTGGDVTLHPRSPHGLRARLTLPSAQE